MIIHQSSIKSWHRCGEQHRRQQQGDEGKQLSRTAYGSVMHHALHTLERNRDLDQAIDTFTYYWHPHHIEAICRPVDVWIGKDSQSGLARQGVEMIKRYWDLKRFEDDEELLALEIPFVVPVHGTFDPQTQEPHYLAGTIDRLALRRYYGRPHLCVDDWKGLALDTPLPTPTGWTTMGHVAVGDELLGADGHPITVTAKSLTHHRPCYRVTFDDGSSVVCDNVHLWQVNHGRRGDVRVMSTQDLARNLTDGRQRDKRIPNAAPLRLPDADLPIHPYVLGAWLGDGKVTSGEISKPDEDLWDNIRACGYEVTTNHPMTRTVRGLRTQLRASGQMGHRVILGIYFRASFAQRLDLLRGLMDTDGTWNRQRRRAVFTTIHKHLATSVEELVVSLGWKAHTFEVQHTGFGKTVTAYDVSFTPVDHNPFWLLRKANLVDTLDVSPRHRARRRHIVAVEPTVTVPTQCVQVDAPDALYLCGEQMVPTHNSGKKAFYLKHNIQGTGYCYATEQLEFWTGSERFMTEGFGERGERLFQQLAQVPRKFYWVNVASGPQWTTGGVRRARDYARFRHAVQQYVEAIQHDIYPLNIDGEICQFCPWQDDCPEGLDELLQQRYEGLKTGAVL